MHASDLAFETALALALTALFSSGVCLLAWRRMRTGCMLLLGVGWGLLCLHWSLLAVSAGPSPVVPRDDIVLFVRIAGLSAVGPTMAGGIAFLRRMLRNGRDST